jgi:hypothetical protein
MVTEGVNYPVESVSAWETRRWDDLASTKITLDRGIKLKTIQPRTLDPEEKRNVAWRALAHCGYVKYRVLLGLGVTGFKLFRRVHKVEQDQSQSGTGLRACNLARPMME